MHKLLDCNEIEHPTARDKMNSFAEGVAKVMSVLERHVSSDATPLFTLRGSGGMVESESVYVGNGKSKGVKFEYSWLFGQTNSAGVPDEFSHWAGVNGFVNHTLFIKATVRVTERSLDIYNTGIRVCYFTKPSLNPMCIYGSEDLSKFSLDNYAEIIGMVEDSKRHLGFVAEMQAALAVIENEKANETGSAQS